MQDKATLRKEIIKKRKEMNKEDAARKSEIICRKIIASGEYKAADNILAYISVQNEVMLNSLIEDAQKSNKTIWLPRVVGDDMEFIKYTSGAPLQKNRYGILEPSGDEKIVPDEETLIIMPGVAFSIKNDRIGFGGGYYDRFLSVNNKCKNIIAVAYEFQICDFVPSEAHDIKPHILITERNEYYA